MGRNKTGELPWASIGFEKKKGVCAFVAKAKLGVVGADFTLIERLVPVDFPLFEPMLNTGVVEE
jgi:hypothetical protein